MPIRLGEFAAAAGVIALVVFIFAIMIISLIVTGIVYVASSNKDKNRYWSVIGKLAFLTFIIFVLLILCVATYASPIASLVIAIITVFVFIVGLFWIFQCGSEIKQNCGTDKCAELSLEEYSV